MFGTFVGFVGTVVGGSLLAADPENLSPAWGYSCVALGATCFVLGTKQVSPPRESKSQGAVVAPMP